MLPFKPLVSKPKSIKDCSKLESGIGVVCAFIIDVINKKKE
jgi:hypothetical protein